MNETTEQTAEQYIREKYNFILEAIKTEHAKNLTYIQELTKTLGNERTEPNLINEGDRYLKELKAFEEKIRQLVLYKDLPELEYTPTLGDSCKEIETMTNEGFINVAKIDVTNPLVKCPKTYIYKFKNKENETI